MFNNQKQKILFAVGKKFLSYKGVRTRFSGRFYGKFPINDPEYRKKKSVALEESEKGLEKKTENTLAMEQRDKLVIWASDVLKVAPEEIIRQGNLSKMSIYRARKRFSQVDVENTG